MTFDYRKLLIAYIAHVGDCEGTDFLGNSAKDGIKGLSEEEVEELKYLSFIPEGASYD
jgi:hypothetical protein